MYLEGTQGNPSDYHHLDEERCDSCEAHKEGTMLYAKSNTGKIMAVLFLCKDCDIMSYNNTDKVPPILKGEHADKIVVK